MPSDPPFASPTNNSQAPIVLLTDFGGRDWFVGVMKGVLANRAPGRPIVDLCHEVAPGDLEAGALMLEAACPYFPSGSVFCCVIDPGVGTDRRVLLVEYTRETGEILWLVGPDNGLLAADPAPGRARYFAFDADRRPDIALPDASTTFHGRDIFAPLAAHIAVNFARGSATPPQEQALQLQAIETLATEIHDPVRLESTDAGRQYSAGASEEVTGRVRYVDRFGNLITDLKYEDLVAAYPDAAPGDWEANVGTGSVRGVSESYGEHERGACLLYVGSLGYLEIAVNMGDASRELQCTTGAPVVLRMNARP